MKGNKIISAAELEKKLYQDLKIVDPVLIESFDNQLKKTEGLFKTGKTIFSKKFFELANRDFSVIVQAMDYFQTDAGRKYEDTPSVASILKEHAIKTGKAIFQNVGLTGTFDLIAIVTDSEREFTLILEMSEYVDLLSLNKDIYKRFDGLYKMDITKFTVTDTLAKLMKLKNAAEPHEAIKDPNFLSAMHGLICSDYTGLDGKLQEANNMAMEESMGIIRFNFTLISGEKASLVASATGHTIYGCTLEEANETANSILGKEFTNRALFPRPERMVIPDWAGEEFSKNTFEFEFEMFRFISGDFGKCDIGIKIKNKSLIGNFRRTKALGCCHFRKKDEFKSELSENEIKIIDQFKVNTIDKLNSLDGLSEQESKALINEIFLKNNVIFGKYINRDVTEEDGKLKAIVKEVTLAHVLGTNATLAFPTDSIKIPKTGIISDLAVAYDHPWYNQ